MSGTIDNKIIDSHCVEDDEEFLANVRMKNRENLDKRNGYLGKIENKNNKLLSNLSDEEKDNLYNNIVKNPNFKEFEETYEKAVKLAETEPSDALKKASFEQYISKLVESPNGNILGQLIKERDYAALFFHANRMYRLSENGEPITLKEILK